MLSSERSGLVSLGARGSSPAKRGPASSGRPFGRSSALAPIFPNMIKTRKCAKLAAVAATPLQAHRTVTTSEES
jgi:hypothetical protein